MIETYGGCEVLISIYERRAASPPNSEGAQLAGPPHLLRRESRADGAFGTSGRP